MNELHKKEMAAERRKVDEKGTVSLSLGFFKFSFFIFYPTTPGRVHFEIGARLTLRGCNSIYIPVLKRLFEYSNIFEQGFQNEYSNTKIENRVIEKVLDRAPNRTCNCKLSARRGRPVGYIPHLTKLLIIHCKREIVNDHEPGSRSRIDIDRSLAILAICTVQRAARSHADIDACAKAGCVG